MTVRGKASSPFTERSYSLGDFLTQSGLATAIQMLDRVERLKLTIIVLSNVLIGVLDFMALLLVGYLGKFAVQALTVSPEKNLEITLFQNSLFASLSFQTKVSVLAIGASTFLIARTILSAFLNRKILFYLSARSAQLSSKLVTKLLSQSIEVLNSKSIQENLYATTSGAQKLMVGVLGVTANLVADVSLVFFVFLGLWILNPLLALTTTLTFAIIAAALFLLLGKRARSLGEVTTNMSIESNKKIIEVLSTYREAFVKGRRDFYSQQISINRRSLANLEAELTFLPLLSKYVMEIAVIFGALTVSAVQFILQDAINAFSALAIFMVAGSRIAPAVLRVQQAALTVRASVPASRRTIELIQTKSDFLEPNRMQSPFPFSTGEGFIPKIKTEGLIFNYQNSSNRAIDNVNVEIGEGQFIAIVGPSGAGKSTLVDLLLGILTPSMGRVNISGISPIEAIEKFTGAISYVPQDVFIVEGSIRDNVCLGYDSRSVPNSNLEWSVEKAILTEFLRSLPDGLDTQVGDYGKRLSGGQRQRLGIARALVTKPRLLILDESTSSLDAKSEADFVSSLRSMKGEVTLLMVAHRLSSVREADVIFYMNKGRVEAQGSFDEVRDKVPDFDTQAQLLGIKR